MEKELLKVDSSKVKGGNPLASTHKAPDHERNQLLRILLTVRIQAHFANTINAHKVQTPHLSTTQAS